MRLHSCESFLIMSSVVQATEGISPDALYSTIDVIISVKEINNFEPEFASTVFSGFIQEGADAGTPVWDSPSMNSALVLQATDPDLEEVPKL